MVFLFLSIISSSFIYITFKLLNKYKIKIFPVIITNYLIASFTGYLVNNNTISIKGIIEADWIYISILIGISFISMFYLIGISTKKTGITVTSISTKMSVVFPMLFSIIYYHESVYLLKIVGILLALSAIIFASLKTKNKQPDIQNMIFPIALFIGMGIVDTLVKYNQQEYLRNTGAIESTTVIFMVSATIGLLIQLPKSIKNRKILKFNALLFGIILGLSNFGSLFFLIQALNSNFTDSSIIFAINNTAIILITTLTGRFFFSEKLSYLNWLGVLFSIIAILALAA